MGEKGLQKISKLLVVFLNHVLPSAGSTVGQRVGWLRGTAFPQKPMEAMATTAAAQRAQYEREQKILAHAIVKSLISLGNRSTPTSPPESLWKRQHHSGNIDLWQTKHLLIKWPWSVSTTPSLEGMR